MRLVDTLVFIYLHFIEIEQQTCTNYAYKCLQN